MSSNLIYSLPLNILSKIDYLRHDYLGLNFTLIPVINFIIGCLLTLLLIFVSYLIGEKIRKLLKTDFKNINYLISISLGYIIFCTGIGVLGFFSLLTKEVLIAYILLILLAASYPFVNLRESLSKLYYSFKSTVKILRSEKFILAWIIAFLLLATIMLINPEIREDQYHVDFPRIYLDQQTIMIPPEEQIHVSASPMLAEMSYISTIFIWSVESARYIHFAFYLLVLLTLLEFARINKYGFSIYAPLVFASAPVIMHETSSVYTDFQWVFFFLLSILILLNRPLSMVRVALAGLLLGAMVSVKLWTIAFIPAFIIFLIIKNYKDLSKIVKYISSLFLGIIIVSFIWFLRAFILTGNPFYPSFTNLSTIGYGNEYFGIFHYLGLNTFLINPFGLITVVSPLFFVGLFLFVYKFKENLILLKLDIFKLTFLLFLTYLLIQYVYGRYLIGLYVLAIFIASIGLQKTLKNFKSVKLFLSVILAIFFLYYFINQILILPYTFGIANVNSYLTRILSRDNSSYYNFGEKFNKYISKNDYIATYKIFGYYYASFKFIDINFIFEKNRNFEELKRHGITKLFIKGGDINWFCKTGEIQDCNPKHYLLISSYNAFPTYYLYAIK